MRVHAEREVAAPPDAVFAFLADLENHWALAAHWVEVRALDRVDHGPARGGRVRLHGPLGLRRTARTRLLELDAPARVAGTAEVGARTRAIVAWELEPRGGGRRTLVRVSTDVQRLGPVDRVLWALVGRRVMARGFPAVLARLDSALAPVHSGRVAPRTSRTSPTTIRPPRLRRGLRPRLRDPADGGRRSAAFSSIHLIAGILGLAAVKIAPAPRAYAAVFGIFWVVLALWGFYDDLGDEVVSGIPSSVRANWFHLALGALGVAAAAHGYFVQQGARHDDHAAGTGRGF